jgi:hypothetical protein
MTPAQIATDIKRLDKEIAKADEAIRASRDTYEPDLSAHRAGWHRSVWSAHAMHSAVFHTHVKDRSVLCVERRLLRTEYKRLTGTEVD